MMTGVFGSELRRVLAKGYQIIKLNQVTNHRSVYLFRDDQGEKVLKPLRIGAWKSQLIGELLKKGFGCPLLPKLIPPNSKNGYANYYWHGGNRFLLTKRIAGREADYFRLADLQAAIRGMAVFHHFSRNLLNNAPERWKMLRFNPGVNWRRCFYELESCRELAIGRGDDWSREYLKSWRFQHELAYQAIKDLLIIQERPKVICYHDWAYHNVIIAEEQAYLIDFDYMLVDWPVHDKVNLISRYLRLHHWSVEALFRALWNFDRYYGWQTGEIRLLRIYLTFPYEYWMLGRQYYLERQPWSKKYYQQQWLGKIAPVKLIKKILMILEALE